MHACRLCEEEEAGKKGKRLAGRQAGGRAAPTKGEWQMVNVIRSESMRFEAPPLYDHIRYNSVFFFFFLILLAEGRCVYLCVCVLSGWCVKVICDILTAFWLSLAFATTYTHTDWPRPGWPMAPAEQLLPSLLFTLCPLA